MFFNGNDIITARKQSCGKVMFLHLSVILFTGDPPPPYGNEQAVRILLECILVILTDHRWTAELLFWVVWIKRKANSNTWLGWRW